MRYAMVLRNRVIDIEISDSIPHYPPDAQGNPVIAIECNESVELGMIYDEESRVFTEYIPLTPTPTQLDRIEQTANTTEQTNLIIMEAMAEQYEQALENRINDMDVQATIYEAILEMGGVV